MIGTESKRWIRVLVVLLAIPGIILLLRDLSRPSRDSVLSTVGNFDVWIERAAVRFKVDPDLIRAVIAVESKGRADARSKAGARGLMQLMPPTGREMAERIGVGVIDDDQLFEPGLNILIGTAYLRAQLDGFDNDLPLALAAYNAGPGNARRWIRTDPDATTAEVIERHGFDETRAYVKKVMAYRAHLKSKEHPVLVE